MRAIASGLIGSRGRPSPRQWEFKRSFKSWIGTEYSLVPISVAFAIFQAVIALTGWESLRYLSRVILPIKLVLLTVVILTFLVSDDQRFLWSNVNSADPGNGAK